MPKPEIYFSVLPDKTIDQYAFLASMAVARESGNQHYTYIQSDCVRTDVARIRLCEAFRKSAKSPNDAIVMLDCDHTHPYDIINRLAANSPDKGVIGALAFRRGTPFYPCFWLRNGNGKLSIPLEFNGSVYKCAIVGTAAILIRRWVLDKFVEAGIKAPFMYCYDDTMFESGEYQSEDVYFGLECEKLGIAHYCDTGLITPHLTTSAIDETAWNAYAETFKHKYESEIERIGV